MRSSRAWAWPSRPASRSCSSAVSGRAARPVTSSTRPAGQPLLPARPGVAGLPGAGQGQGEPGERRVACRQRRFEPFRAPQPGLFVTRRGRGPGPEGFVVLALTVERPGQVVVAGGGVGVVLAQGLEPDRQGPAEHRLGLGVLALGLEGHGQVVVAGGGVGVVLAQGLEPDRQGAAVHRLGLGVLALGLEGRGQVVVAGGGVGVVLAQGLERIARALRCIASASACLPWPGGSGQVVVAGGGVGVVLAQGLSRIARARRCSASASAYFPWSWRVAARLL